MTKIAFLGLGAMGARMATRLVEARFEVAVWNRDAGKADALVAAGARRAASPAEAARAADIVVSMVTDDVAAEAVWLAPGTGAVAALRPGVVAIECSTVSPNWIARLAAAVAARGAAFLDAPVAGSLPQAETGKLVFMVGGEADVLERARPVLAPLAVDVIHAGGIGQGAVLKLAVNGYFAAQLASLAELLGFLARNGFDAIEAADLLGKFPIVAPPLAGAAKMMAAGNTTPLFTIDLIEKDLGYILDTAKASGSELPGAASAQGAFQRAQARGLGQSNVSGLAKVFSS